MRKDPPVLPSWDPPHDPDEPSVRRWPRALRLIFLLLAGVAGWAAVIALIWLLWKRFGA